MAATRFHPSSPAPRRPLTRRSRSYPLHYRDDSDSETSVSDSSDQGKEADVHEPQRVRAEIFTNSGATRPGETNRKRMASHKTRRPSDTIKYSTKESRVTVRQVPRRQSSQRRHRPDRDEYDEADVHIVKRHRSSKESTEKVRPAIMRRSTTTGVASRLREERSYRDRESSRKPSDGRTPSRKQSERRPNQNERMFSPVRREIRSTVDNVTETAKDTRHNPPVKRSASIRENSSISLLRPFLSRSKSSTQKPRRSSYTPPLTPRREEKMSQRPPPPIRGFTKERSNDRLSSIFGSLLGSPLGSPKPPKSPKRAESIRRPEAVKKPEPIRKPEHERQYDLIYPDRPLATADTATPRVECLTCMSDVSISRSVKLKCGHRMCNSCLRRIFNLSVTDPQHMPPKCCTADAIPLENVDKLFDLKFKKLWNRKYQEYMTKNRIYCPARRCGEWIKPSHIYTDTSGGANHGRKYGKCGRCQTKVCCLCNNKWHSSKECPKDLATQEFIKVAKKEGWQRCYNCKATVELIHGCNHMTCRCRAEFCMICGSQWKTCDCPWFNYEAVEADRLDHMNVPQVPGRFPAANPNPARGYQEEIDRRREQERRDEELARRLQGLGLGDPENFYNAEEGFGNAGGHFMNQDFVNRAQHILSGNNNAAQAEAAENLLNEAHNFYHQQRPPAPRPPLNHNRPQQPQILRAHTTASRNYNNRPTTRASERVVPRRVNTDYATEAERHRPVRDPIIREAAPPRTSQLAGITRGRTAEGRVDEWRQHVEGDDGGENEDLVPEGW